MSLASFLVHRRRPLVLGTATFLLHWAVLGWLNAQLGPAQRSVRDAPALVVAQVLAPRPAPPPAPPQPAPANKPAAPEPPRPEHPKAAPAPAPVADPVLPVVAEVAAEVAAVPEPGSGAVASIVVPVQDGAAGAAAGVQSSVQAGPAPAAAAPPAYRVDMPPPADIAMDVARIDADGTRWSGEAVISWRFSGASYRVKVEAGIRLLFARVNLVELTSEGTVLDTGFAPLTMTEKRRGRSLTATHFNRQDGKITFSASQAAYPLQPGAQDKASVPLQLAAIARADASQLQGDIDIQVGEDRDASVFRFVVVGRETIDTRLGALDTLHLSRPPMPGSYKSRLDVWLAPARGWFPVQIRNTEASGAVTTQTVNNIVMTATGS